MKIHRYYPAYLYTDHSPYLCGKITQMKKIILSVFLVPLLFSACTDENRGFALSDREKALVLSVRADTLFWGAAAEIDFDTVIDLSPALEKIDEAFRSIRRTDNITIKSSSTWKSPDVRMNCPASCGNSPRWGKRAIIPSWHRLAGALPAKARWIRPGTITGKRSGYAGRTPFPTRETAYVDSAYVAHLEYYITGDREAALRKIRESADTLRMSEEHKSHLRQILADFDADQSFWNPNAVGRRKKFPSPAIKE